MSYKFSLDLDWPDVALDGDNINKQDQNVTRCDEYTMFDIILEWDQDSLILNNVAIVNLQ